MSYATADDEFYKLSRAINLPMAREIANAHEALDDLGVPREENGMDLSLEGRLRKIFDAVIEQPAYGCHFELDPGKEPDWCVIDEGLPSACPKAMELLRKGKGRNDCDEWRPIEVKS